MSGTASYCESEGQRGVLEKDKDVVCHTVFGWSKSDLKVNKFMVIIMFSIWQKSYGVLILRTMNLKKKEVPRKN